MENANIKSKFKIIDGNIVDSCLLGMNLKIYKDYKWEKGPLSQWDTGSEEIYYNYEGNIPTNSREEQVLWNNGVGRLSIHNNIRDIGYGTVFKTETISYLSKNGHFNLYGNITNDESVSHKFEASFSTDIGIFVIKDNIINYYDLDAIDYYIGIRVEKQFSKKADQSDEMKNILLNNAKIHYNSGSLDELDEQIMTNPTEQYAVDLNEAILFANALANNDMEIIRSFSGTKRR